jgi:hypothetical protein
MTTTRPVVEIADVAVRVEPEPGLDLEYTVRNGHRQAVWLVDDDDLVWSRRDDRIELSFARAHLAADVEPFGYFAPDTCEVGAGGVVERRVHLTWPQPLNRLWNDRAEAAPPPGLYRLRVRVGYGLTPSPEPSELDEDVDASVLRWQHEAVSEPVEVRVPDYSVDGAPQ